MLTQGVASPPWHIARPRSPRGGLAAKSLSPQSCARGRFDLSSPRVCPQGHRGHFGALRIGARLVNRAATYGAGRGAPGVEPGPPMTLPWARGRESVNSSSSLVWRSYLARPKAACPRPLHPRKSGRAGFQGYFDPYPHAFSGSGARAFVGLAVGLPMVREVACIFDLWRLAASFVVLIRSFSSRRGPPTLFCMLPRMCFCRSFLWGGAVA